MSSTFGPSKQQAEPTGGCPVSLQAVQPKTALVLAKNLSPGFWASRIYFPASLRSRWVWFPPVNTTMKALTPQRSASQVRGTAEVSLLISIELPNIPSPTTLLPFRDARFRTLHFLTVAAAAPPCGFFPPPGVGPRLGRVVRSGVRELPRCSPTGLAESSSLALRTALSSPVALHPFC